MRLPSIRTFDILYLGSLVLGVVNSLLPYRQNAEQLAADPALGAVGSGFILVITVFAVGIPLFLWWLISLRASNIAKWILFAFTVFGLVLIPGTITRFEGLTSVLTLAITGLQIAALVYLFKPDAKAYLTGEREV